MLSTMFCEEFNDELYSINLVSISDIHGRQVTKRFIFSFGAIGYYVSLEKVAGTWKIIGIPFFCKKCIMEGVVTGSLITIYVLVFQFSLYYQIGKMYQGKAQTKLNY